MTELEPDRWLPVRLLPQPVGSRIEWVFFGAQPLSHPFFHQSVVDLRASFPHRVPRYTSLDALGQTREGLAPTAFIFHISRCGSTFLSNALRAAAGMIVVSEAQPLTSLFTPSVPDAGSQPTCVQEEKRQQLLKDLFRSYGQPARASDCGIIFKFTSWNILRLRAIRSWWPSVPCLIVVRHPIEVLASCMQGPPGWMRLKERSSAAAALFGWEKTEVERMSLEEYSARVIGAFLDCALESFGEGCLIIDYSALNEDGICRVANHLGIPTQTFNEAVLKSALENYSKSRGSHRPHRDDSIDKRRSASPQLCRMSEHFAEKSYRNARQLAILSLSGAR